MCRIEICMLVILCAFTSISMQFNLPFDKFVLNTTETDACIEDLQSYTNHFLGSKSLISLFMYTAKELNDLGDHKNCKKKLGNYLVVDFTKDNVPVLSLGGCVPLKCSPGYVQKYRKDMARTVNNMQDQFIFNENEVVIYSPQEKNEGISKLGVGFVFTCVLILLAVIGQILGTCMTGKAAKGGYEEIENGKTLLSCFDFMKNSRLVFYGENDIDSSLDVLNGVRVLAMFWIILGQTLVVTLKAPVYNFAEVQQIIKENRWFAIFTSAPLAIDVFLCLSGFFAMISCFKVFQDESNRTPLNFVKLYAYRYLRLLPIYVMGMLVANFLIPILNDGPIYPRVEELQQNCSTNWLWNYLFLNNFVDSSHLCLNWSWYLSLDFQLFLLAPFLSLILIKLSKRSYWVLAGIMTASIGIQIFIIADYELNLYYLFDKKDTFEQFTVKPYCRINTYLLGLIFAWMYLSKSAINEKLENSKILRYSSYVIGIMLMFFTIYIYPIFYETVPKDLAYSALYSVLSKPFFIIGLFMVIYPALLKKCRGSVVLSVEVWAPLARSTYSAYMLHFAVLMFYTMALEEGIFFSFHKLTRSAIDIIVVTYLGSLLLTLLFDFPLRRVWKKVLGLDKNKMKEDDQPQNITQS